MKYPLVLAAMVVLMFCTLGTGCTSPTEAKIRPVATTVPALPQTPPVSTSTAVSTPQPVETLPYEQHVDIHVEKQRPDASIHLRYYGGPGEAYIQNIMMRVTRPDGTVEEQFMKDGILKPRRNDELVMDGSRGVDQVAVVVISRGKSYTVYDTPLAYPQI